MYEFYITYLFLSNFVAWPFGTLIIIVVFVSINVGTGVLSRTQVGRVVVFNTHSCLASRLSISWSLPFLSYLHQ